MVILSRVDRRLAGDPADRAARDRGVGIGQLADRGTARERFVGMQETEQRERERCNQSSEGASSKQSAMCSEARHPKGQASTGPGWSQMGSRSSTTKL